MLVPMRARHGLKVIGRASHNIYILGPSLISRGYSTKHSGELILTKEMKVTVVPFNETLDEYFKPPSKWFFVCATGDHIYLHTKLRSDAVAYIREDWQGKYQVRCAKADKSSGTESAVGRINSKSRQGSKIVN